MLGTKHVVRFMRQHSAASVVGLSVAVLTAIVAVSGAIAAAPFGSVERVVGEAFVSRGDTERTPLSETDELFAGDLIETPTNGGVSARLGDGGAISMGGDSSAAFMRYAFDVQTQSGEAVFNLLGGTFRFTTGTMLKPGISLRSEAALVSPRGSDNVDMEITVGDDGETAVTVLAGLARVEPAGLADGCEIGPDETATVSDEGEVECPTLEGLVGIAPAAAAPGPGPGGEDGGGVCQRVRAFGQRRRRVAVVEVEYAHSALTGV